MVNLCISYLILSLFNFNVLYARVTLNAQPDMSGCENLTAVHVFSPPDLLTAGQVRR